MKLGKYAKRSTRAGWHSIERQIVKEQSPRVQTNAISKIRPSWHKAMRSAVVAMTIAGSSAEAKDCSVIRQTYPITDSGMQVGTVFVSYEKTRVCYGQLANPETAKAIEPTVFCFDLKNVTPSSLSMVTILKSGAQITAAPFPIEDAALASYMAHQKCERPWFNKESIPISLKK